MGRTKINNPGKHRGEIIDSSRFAVKDSVQQHVDVPFTSSSSRRDALKIGADV